MERIHRGIHCAHTAKLSLIRHLDAKQLPNEDYNILKTDTTVLNQCERKYLHYLNLAKSLENKWKNALTELNRYKDLISKYKESKSEKKVNGEITFPKQEKAKNIEDNILPQLVFNYQRYIELFNEATR